MTLIAVEIVQATAAPGDEKAHSAKCQVFPVILPCCNLNPFCKTTLSPSWKLSYSQQISQGQTLNQDKLLSAPATSIIYNNLHILLILPKYHLLQNSAALLQMKTVRSICFKPGTMLLLTIKISAKDHHLFRSLDILRGIRHIRETWRPFLLMRCSFCLLLTLLFTFPANRFPMSSFNYCFSSDQHSVVLR